MSQNKKLYIALTLTNDCNKRCPWCARPWVEFGKRTDKLSFEKIQNILNIFKTNKNYTAIGLYGGEPGLLTRNEHLQIKELLIDNGLAINPDTVILMTNGLAIKRYADIWANTHLM